MQPSRNPRIKKSAMNIELHQDQQSSRGSKKFGKKKDQRFKKHKVLSTVELPPQRSLNSGIQFGTRVHLIGAGEIVDGASTDVTSVDGSSTSSVHPGDNNLSQNLMLTSLQAPADIEPRSPKRERQSEDRPTREIPPPPISESQRTYRLEEDGWVEVPHLIAYYEDLQRERDATHRKQQQIQRRIQEHEDLIQEQTKLKKGKGRAKNIDEPANSSTPSNFKRKVGDEDGPPNPRKFPQFQPEVSPAFHTERPAKRRKVPESERALKISLDNQHPRRALNSLPPERPHGRNNTQDSQYTSMVSQTHNISAARAYEPETLYENFHVPECIRDKCICRSLPMFFTGKPGRVPNLAFWPGAKIDFLRNCFQISNCKGHTLRVRNACRSICENHDYPRTLEDVPILGFTGSSPNSADAILPPLPAPASNQKSKKASLATTQPMQINQGSNAKGRREKSRAKSSPPLASSSKATAITEINDRRSHISYSSGAEAASEASPSLSRSHKKKNSGKKARHRLRENELEKDYNHAQAQPVTQDEALDTMEGVTLQIEREEELSLPSGSSANTKACEKTRPLAQPETPSLAANSSSKQDKSSKRDETRRKSSKKTKVSDTVILPSSSQATSSAVSPNLENSDAQLQEERPMAEMMQPRTHPTFSPKRAARHKSVPVLGASSRNRRSQGLEESIVDGLEGISLHDLQRGQMVIGHGVADIATEVKGVRTTLKTLEQRVTNSTLQPSALQAPQPAPPVAPAPPQPVLPRPKSKMTTAELKHTCMPELDADTPYEYRHSDEELIFIGRRTPGYKRHEEAPYAFTWWGRLRAEYDRLLTMRDEDGEPEWDAKLIARLKH